MKSEPLIVLNILKIMLSQFFSILDPWICIGFFNQVFGFDKLKNPGEKPKNPDWLGFSKNPAGLTNPASSTPSPHKRNPACAQTQIVSFVTGKIYFYSIFEIHFFALFRGVIEL